MMRVIIKDITDINNDSELIFKQCSYYDKKEKCKERRNHCKKWIYAHANCISINSFDMC